MYDGQFDQLTSLSVSDESAAALTLLLVVAPPVEPAAGLLPAEPQAASEVTAATPAKPAMPAIAVRRESRPRAIAAWKTDGT